MHSAFSAVGAVVAPTAGGEVGMEGQEEVLNVAVDMHARQRRKAPAKAVAVAATKMSTTTERFGVFAINGDRIAGVAAAAAAVVVAGLPASAATDVLLHFVNSVL